MDSAGSGQVVTIGPATPVVRRRDVVRPGEGPRERLRRGVPRIHGDVDDGCVDGHELVGRTLEQQASTEPARRLAERRRHQPVEVESRQVRPIGQVTARRLGLVEACLDHVEDRA